MDDFYDGLAAKLYNNGYCLKVKAACCKTDYWMKAESKFVLAIVHSPISHGDVSVCLTKEICEKFGWKSICLRVKGGILTPYVNINGKKIDVHTIAMDNKRNADLELDHSLHTRLFIDKDFMRTCTRTQNGYNKVSRQKQILGFEDSCHFKDNVSTTLDLSVLQKKGFEVTRKKETCKDGTPKYRIKSPFYDAEESWQEGVDYYENLVYGKFRYKRDEDFTDSVDLLIRCFILEEISLEEARKINLMRKDGNI